MTTNSSDTLAPAAAGETTDTTVAANPAAILGSPTGPDYSFLPAKTRVQKEDGSIDLDATLRKGEEARAALERRLGMGDTRPATVDEYALDVREEHKPFVEAFGEDMLKSFRAKAFAMGLTPSQFNGVMGEFLDTMPALAKDVHRFDQAAAIEALRAEWPSDRDFKLNINRAVNAVVAFGGSHADADGLLQRYGNDPSFIKTFARIGAEIGEDTAPQQPNGPRAIDISHVERSEAYRNPNHPDHASVSARVAAHYQANYRPARDDQVPVFTR